MLAGPEVLVAMANAFVATPERELAARLFEQYGDEGMRRYRRPKL